MNRHYPAVAERAAHRCEYCRAPEAIFDFPFEVEHVVPASQGGDDKLDIALFHPRQQLWDEHISMHLQTGVIGALTDMDKARFSVCRSIVRFNSMQGELGSD